LPDHPGVGAGIYLTLANVIGIPSLRAAVQQVFASVWGERAFVDRRRVTIDETKVLPAVWMVPSIDADYSFYLHSSDVSTGRSENAIIEVAQGIGESLASDDPRLTGRPTRVVWNKNDD